MLFNSLTAAINSLASSIHDLASSLRAIAGVRSGSSSRETAEKPASDNKKRAAKATKTQTGSVVYANDEEDTRQQELQELESYLRSREVVPLPYESKIVEQFLTGKSTVEAATRSQQHSEEHSEEQEE